MIMTMQTKRMADVLGARAGNVVQGLFDRMEVAEDEIAKAMVKHPTARLAIDKMFGHLCPPAEFAGRAEQVYRAHCRELCERAATGRPIAPGTDAEALCCLLDASLKAPLNSTGCALAEVLFKRVFSFSVAGEAPREPYPGAMEELLAECKRKTAVKERVLE